MDVFIFSFVISLCLVLSEQIPASEQRYEERVNNWMDDFRASDKCDPAETNVMFNNISSYFYKATAIKSQDEIPAAKIARLYTFNYDCFYAELNAQLRGFRSSRVDEIFREYAVLLNESINILLPVLNGRDFLSQTVKNFTVYRGTSNESEFSGNPNDVMRNLKAFTSTSKNANQPFQFFRSTQKKIYIAFKKVFGLAVDAISAFPAEEEVILPYNYTVKIKKYTTDQKEIEKYVDHPFASMIHVYIEATGDNDDDDDGTSDSVQISTSTATIALSYFLIKTIDLLTI